MFYGIDLLEEKKTMLEYEFSKKITFWVIVKQLVFTFSSFFFLGRFVYTDLLVLFSIIPCYVIIYSNPKYNFQKIGKLGAYYFLAMSVFFSSMYYYGFSFIVITNAVFPICFLFYYTFKKSILYSLLIFLHFPIVYFFYDYNVKVTEAFIIQKEITQFLHFLFFVIFLLITVFYLLQVAKIKAVIDYIKSANVKIDSFFWGIRGKEEIVYTKQKNDIDTIESGEYYNSLFTKIEAYMRSELPWKDATFSLDKLALGVNSNTMYVSTAINKMTNSNFKTYVNEYRLNAIIEEIKQKVVKKELVVLKDIYLNNGFNHQATFNKVFKSKFGITPQDYFLSI